LSITQGENAGRSSPHQAYGGPDEPSQQGNFYPGGFSEIQRLPLKKCSAGERDEAFPPVRKKT